MPNLPNFGPEDHNLPDKVYWCPTVVEKIEIALNTVQVRDNSNFVLVGLC